MLRELDYNASHKYISPMNTSDNKSSIENEPKVFEYGSSRRSKSFDYSAKECPNTPDKRNKRNMRNTDLLSPVTRILSLDNSSSKVSYFILNYNNSL